MAMLNDWCMCARRRPRLIPSRVIVGKDRGVASEEGGYCLDRGRLMGNH